MKQLCVLPQCNVFNLYQDSSGDIWVCTWEDGLYHISDNGTVHYTDGEQIEHIVYHPTP